MAATEHSGRDVVQSLERGLLVLRAFSHERRPLTISEIAESVDLSRPTVRRMLLTLEGLGYTVQNGSRWTLTPRVLEIGSGYFVETSIPEIAQPFLHELADEIGETCTIGVYDRGDVVQVGRAEVQRLVPDNIRVGTRLPAYATALGAILLGSLEPAELDAYFSTYQREPLTRHTATKEKDVRKRIDDAKAAGYAASSEELELGMIAIAVPIKIESLVIAGLGMASTTARTDLETMIERALPPMLATADEIARIYQLGNPYGRLPRTGR